MKKSIKYNYYNILSLKPRILMFLLMLFITTFLIIYYLTYIEVYSQEEYYAIFRKHYLYVNIPIQDSDIINNGKFLKINGTKYNYQIINIGLLNYDEINNIYYQEYVLQISKDFLDNEIKKISIYFQHKITFDKLIKIFT